MGDEFLIKFSVIDTGIGVPKDKLHRLFKKFSQIDSSISRKFGGTGLGLAISKKLAEMMGGEIGVESEEGKGSTFWITVKLPRGTKREEAVTIYEHRKKKIEDKHIKLSGRVLVVEDNQVNQKVIIELLKMMGLRAEAVNNGQEAIEILELIPYDLVLMDVQMPVMDGLSATRAIRAPGSGVLNPHLPIVALTAHAMKDEASRCMDAGMNDYLSKPINPQALEEVLKKWLPVQPVADVNKRGEAKEQQDSSKGDIREDEEGEIFDRDDFLARVINNDELGRQVLSIFIENSSGVISNIETAIERGDHQEITLLAHTLKGSANNVGAKRVGNIAFRIERLCKRKKIDEARELLKRLKEEFKLFSEDKEVKDILDKKA